jgi:hypothetical protein
VPLDIHTCELGNGKLLAFYLLHGTGDSDDSRTPTGRAGFILVNPFLTPPSENKCASPYIGERLGENGVGGKWLMGALLRIPLTLSGQGNGVVGG